MPVNPKVCAASDADGMQESAREEPIEDDTVGSGECFHTPRGVDEVPSGDSTSSGSNSLTPPIASPEVAKGMEAREELKKQKRRDSRRLAQSKYHLLDHYEYNPDCLGCQAKARNKKHFKGAFDRDNAEYDKVVSMDQGHYGRS